MRTLLSSRFPIHRAASAGLSASETKALGILPEWNLTDLYPGTDSAELKSDFEWVEQEARKFAADYRGKLDALLKGSLPSSALHEAIKRYEAIDDKLGRILSYAGLVYSGDTTDPARAKFYSDTQDRATTLSTELLFFTLELNRLDDAILDQAAAQAPLSHYAPWLKDIRLEKPYQLDDKLEQIFLEKSVTGVNAWNRLFDETMAALRFEFDGEELTLEPILNKFQDPDDSVRRRASDALANTFRANLRTFSLITNTLAKDKEISDRWRNFTDIADSRHLSNRVEREVVEALVSAVRAAYPRLSHRYYKLKAKWFGKDALDHWDRNAPLPQIEQPTIPWTDARSMVLEAYRDFSSRMASIANDFFDKNWIDAPVRSGKAPGAFAHPTVPSAHPYVLVNYLGKPRDVMTLAHELGHGVHQVLAASNGALMAPTPLTLAETASVFGEMLTFRRLLDRTKDQKQRKSMLAAKVEDMINTVVRQIAFYTFEREIHQARRNGEITSEQIGEIWLKLQSESLGPSIRLGDGYETFWTYIPHFIHSPFYVYAYAFGDCLVNSLYAVYENAVEGFAERYLAMLAAGGTKHHSELLAPFGLNARDPAFWQVGLSLIERMIVELESMD
ncbi:MAG: M3 family oligoendopeptidase [Alphaproteobacteria bacterium]|nr:M3 family oligoendopeptidase [Alphaproteobacteria bacterium]